MSVPDHSRLRESENIHQKDHATQESGTNKQTNKQEVMTAESDSPFYHPAALAPHLASCVVELWSDIKKAITI